MDAITRTIIANVDRMLAASRCRDICGGLTCYGSCRPLVLDVDNLQSDPTEPRPVIATPPEFAVESESPDVTDELQIPIVIFTPAQLYVDGDRRRGFRRPTIGAPGTTTWTALVNVLSRAPEGDPTKSTDPDIQKAARGGWSACKLTEGRRLGSAFVETRLLGLDIDGNGAVDRVVKALQPFKKVVHSTYKSTAEAPRCRVILPLKEPCCDVAVFRRAHRVLRDVLVRTGGYREEDFDAAGSDPSRLWYLPMVRPGESYTFVVTDGELLDVTRLGSAGTSNARRPLTKASHRESNSGAALAWGARKLREASEGRRHTTAFSMAAWLAEIEPPIPEDDIVEALSSHAPEGREAEFLRTIADGVRRGRAA